MERGARAALFAQPALFAKPALGSLCPARSLLIRPLPSSSTLFLPPLPLPLPPILPHHAQLLRLVEIGAFSVAFACKTSAGRTDEPAMVIVYRVILVAAGRIEIIDRLSMVVIGANLCRRIADRRFTEQVYLFLDAGGNVFLIVVIAFTGSNGKDDDKTEEN